MSFNLYAVNRSRLLQNCLMARRCKLVVSLRHFQRELADLHLIYCYEGN